MLVRREHRTIAAQLDYCLRLGQLRSILPGIYTGPQPTIEARVRAAAAFRPGSVITGAAAAALLWWPECPVSRVSVALAAQVAAATPGFCWERRTVPADLIVDREEVRLASPELSVLDLLPTMGGQVIDEALRRGVVRLDELYQALALTRDRRGNLLRRTLLDDSRDEPWSEAERIAHRVLRLAGLSGFRTNFPIAVAGVTFLVDIAYPVERVVIEVDGWRHNGSREAFERDRWRYSRLGAAGWTVLPLPARAFTDDADDVVELVRAALNRQ